MNNAEQVDKKVRAWIDGGMAKAEVVWNTALACVGWPYVYSAWGDLCTPAERRKRYRMCPTHTTIKTKCPGFDSGNCNGCQWYPKKKRVRCYDCRGFTDWCLRQVGIDLYGDTCSTMWNHKANWCEQGVIGTMPKSALCCLFVYKDGKWKHTGFGYGQETVECSSGVQYSKKRAAKWTHWAVPAGLYDTPPEPEPGPKPTLRRGSTGPYVVECQNDLISLGYDVGKTGADGKFGKNTEKAVKAFQKDKKLTVDGIVGPVTWAALDAAIAKLNEGSVS